MRRFPRGPIPKIGPLLFFGELPMTELAMQPNVLVVDDNSIARRVLARQLQQKGYQTLEAGDGTSALTALKDHQVDIILLDLVMTPVSGLDILKQLRSLRTPLELPIVMMSATRDAELILQASHAGSNDFLLRPCPIPALQDKLAYHLKICQHKESDTLEPGSQLGPYRIDSLLGQGAMGKVFQATDTRLLRTVALKVLTPDQEHLQEARALARIKHPNVATIYDVAAGRWPYLAMELIQGSTLTVHPDPQPLEWILQILDALTAIHEQEIVHRDLKPDNILIQNGQIKLVDFGVAQFLESTETSRGKLHGTPAWMSPEQIQHKPLDGRSDLFAAAIILYQMLSGRHPFPATQIKQQLFLNSTQDPEPLEHDLKDIIFKALSKNPDERFQSAAEFQQALKSI